MYCGGGGKKCRTFNWAHNQTQSAFFHSLRTSMRLEIQKSGFKVKKRGEEKETCRKRSQQQRIARVTKAKKGIGEKTGHSARETFFSFHCHNSYPILSFILFRCCWPVGVCCVLPLTRRHTRQLSQSAEMIKQKEPPWDIWNASTLYSSFLYFTFPHFFPHS